MKNVVLEDRRKKYFKEKSEIESYIMKLLTRKEAAEMLRLSLRKLDALAAEGALRFVKLGKGKRARVLYRIEDLESFIADHLSSSSEEIDRKARQIVDSVKGP